MFFHPFTANVSGPTFCGKTYFVKTLLQNCMTKISPPPQKIIWLYKRWQPLYDVIKTTVSPQVEFIQGIPLDLDQDSFINPRIRNLVILDDLMSSSAKDHRVNELFTEGSHHRNMSVIAINQNLFYNKDPTQRRNCHYLVLFNNPVDQQQVMTLARQMYPGNAKHLMRHFKTATSKPYGYLVIDLKPFTPDHLRMRTDVLATPIKEEQLTEGHHFPIDFQTDRTCPEPTATLKVEQPKKEHHLPVDDQTKQTCQEPSEMPSCDDCGIMFDNTHDLQRHVKTWCPEKRKREDDDEDQPPTKKPRLAEDEENREHKIPHLEEKNREQEAFQSMIYTAKKDNEDEWLKKVEKYEKAGLTKKEAKDKANKKLKGEDFIKAMTRYRPIVKYILYLRKGSVHAHVMSDVENLLDDGYGVDKAIKMSLKKNKHILEEVFDEDDSDEEDEDDIDEDNSDVEDDSDEEGSDEESEDGNDEEGDE